VQVRFSPPPVTDSPLARLDARWRLAAGLLLLAAVAAVRTLPAGAAALAAALLLALFVVPLPLLSPAADAWRLAGLFVAKGLALFTLACVLLVTAPLETSFKAARALYVPGLLVHLALLSYRYLFVLGDELVRLRVALRVRGFRNRANRHSYRTVGAAAGALLVRGHDRAERVAAAMRCRGFDGTFRSLAAFRTRAVDVAAFFLILTGAGALAWLDGWFG
jgi:cobalt/nickel transport system permease protein